MYRHELQQKVDYLYCDECGQHMACIRLEPGVWEVQCPRCVAKCGLCSCRSTGSCFTKGRVPVQTHMFIASLDHNP